MEDFKVPGLPIAPGTNTIKKTLDTANTSEDVEVEDTAIALTDGSPAIPTKTTPTDFTASDASCPYKAPVWSAPPTDGADYSFEVLKSGQIIESVNELQRKAVWLFGRLPSNDIEMAHPTISRFHAVLQYRPLLEQQQQLEKEEKSEEPSAKDAVEKHTNVAEGWYIYDLGSTHGTFLNKQRIPNKTYIRIKVGHMLRMGASTRNYILQGPSADEEPESTLSITELRTQRQHQLEADALAAQAQAAAREREGISWGMSEDADEETDLSINPYASTNNEELFLEDPKRTLRGFFEREGLELEYKCDEMSTGSFVCRVELPLDDSNGRPLVAEVVHKGRKKECVVQCALEACRLLDRHGVLRQAHHEPMKRRLKTAASDDEDEFWDRTGDVERKKMRKAQAGADVTLTYEDLLKQETQLLADIESSNSEIEKYQQTQRRLKAQNNATDDIDLDNFIEQLGNSGEQLDKTEIRKLRLEQQRLAAEHIRLQRLLKVAKPIELPFQIADKNVFSKEATTATTPTITKQLPLIGKRNQFSKFKVLKKTDTIIKAAKTPHDVDEEMDDANDDVEEVEEKEKAEEPVPSKKVALQPDACTKVETTVENIVEDTCSTSKTIETVESKSNDCQSAADETFEAPVNPAEKQAAVEEFQSTETEALDNAATATAHKRQRSRQRARNKRTEVDIDELAVHETDEKYAKWVPPENQTGDGITELNKKFGY